MNAKEFAERHAGQKVQYLSVDSDVVYGRVIGYSITASYVLLEIEVGVQISKSVLLNGGMCLKLSLLLRSTLAT